MSGRAAWRLESLGCSLVYRYAAGKLDWFAWALPMEGEFAAIPKAGDVIRHEVPTCALTERLGEVYQHCQAAGWKVCIVVNDSRIVLGRLRREAWKADPETPVEQVMEEGPTTFRPDHFLEPLVRRMRDKKVGSVIVTNPDGALLGILYRKDAEERLQEERLRKGGDEKNAGQEWVSVGYRRR